MEPVDQIKARADALTALGLGQNANADDIRKAWRDIAFHAHPDCTKGDTADFARAKEAYDLLRNEGFVGKGARTGQPKRPTLRKRLISLKDTDIDACRALLNKALEHAPDASSPTSEAGQLAASDHIPQAVGCFGRNLTYFVTSPVCEGTNRVALPTSVLAGTRTVETDVLSFQSKDSGPGEVVIPETIMTRKFPGAKSVRIRFEADKHIQDEFWLAG